MQAIYAFGLLILLAYLGSRFIRRGMHTFSPLVLIFHSGLIYIVLGLYLGGRALNVLSPSVLQGFHPLIALGLGWVGFLFGFQLEYRYLKRFPLKYLGLSWLHSLCVFLLVTAVMTLVFARWVDAPSLMRLGMAVALGILAGIHSPTLMNLVSSLISRRGHFSYLARFMVSVGGFWGIAGMAVLASFWHYPVFDKGLLLKGTIMLGVSTLVPGLMGILFHGLTSKRVSEPDLLVYLLGMVFFVSGAAFYFNLLPLYVCMVFGIFYSNLTRRHEKIYPILLSTEKPLYIVLLILVGALWNLDFSGRIAALALLLFGLRLVIPVIITPALGRLLKFPYRLPMSFGLSLLSAGGLGVAFAVSIKIAYPGELSDVFFSVALSAIILGEILSPWAIKTALFRKGDEE